MTFASALHLFQCSSGLKPGLLTTLPCSSLLHHCFPLPLYCSPQGEQSHEPLMRGFRFFSAERRLELMNKSSEWHVITGRRERDGTEGWRWWSTNLKLFVWKICEMSDSTLEFSFFPGEGLCG